MFLYFLSSLIIGFILVQVGKMSTMLSMVFTSAKIAALIAAIALAVFFWRKYKVGRRFKRIAPSQN